MARSRLNDDTAHAGAAFRTVEDMRSLVWELNEKARKRRWPRWNIIREMSEDRAGWEMDHVVGADAEEVWMLLDDKPLVPVGWPSAQVHKAICLARWRLQRGMPADYFMLWASPAREERRRAWVASQLRESGPAEQESELV